MESNQSVLYVGTCTEFWSGTHQDSHLSSPYLCKQFRFLCLRVVFMDKSNLFFRDSFFCQFVPDIIIYVESPISFGCGQVTEDQLGCPVCFSFFPYLRLFSGSLLYTKTLRMEIRLTGLFTLRLRRLGTDVCQKTRLVGYHRRSSHRNSQQLYLHPSVCPKTQHYFFTGNSQWTTPWVLCLYPVLIGFSVFLFRIIKNYLLYLSSL